MFKISKFFLSITAAAAIAVAPIQAGLAYGADLPDCTITKTAASETYSGTEGADVICTGGGNDIVYALGGDDVVIVQGGGTVQVDLGDGDDVFYGGVGITQYHAIVHGGEGDDEINGTPGADELYGDEGNDEVYGGEGADSIYGGYGSDSLNGDNGADEILGEAGPDDINGGWGSDTLNGGADTDSLLGGFGNDDIYGGGDRDYLQGDTGEDHLYGESGTDTLAGGEGYDIIAGGDGTDTLEGGWGLNLCDYSTGEIKGDTCIYDDKASLIVSANWDQGSYETGSAPVTIGLNITIKDDVAVRSVTVSCNIPDVLPWSMSQSWTGFQTEVSTKLTHTLDKGTKPGIYDCYASGHDQVNNRFHQKIASLQLTRGAGVWDDDAPKILDSFWDPASYDVSQSAQTGLLNLHATDRTGISSISLYCDDLTAHASGLDSNLNNPALAANSGSNKDFVATLKLEIPYGHKPGIFPCSIRIHDKNKNYAYQSVASLVITRDYGPNGYGSWDETAPVVEYGVWNQTKFDAGQTAQSAMLSLHITDASGVRNLYVSCANLFNTHLYNLNVNDLANNPAIASVQGDRKDLYITFANTILLGQYPGNYPCYVWGVDDFGNNFWETIDPLTVWRTPPGMPNEPTNFAYEVFNGSSGVLTWTAPSFKGSPALKDYVIEYSLDGGETYKAINDGYSTTPRLPISNLKDNTDYRFRIRGENGGGIDAYTSKFMELSWAYLDVRTPEAVLPNVPTDLKVTDITKSSFKLGWKTPVDDGGAYITNFSVELSRDNGATWVSPKVTETNSQEFTVYGTAPGTTYQVRIAAVNKVGRSEYLSGSVTTLATVASKPLNMRLYTQGGGQAILNWDLPATNGGAAIFDYKVEMTSATAWTTITHAPSNSLSYTITGLQKGKTYKVRVSAITSVGEGDVSDVFTFTAATTAPGVPTNLKVGSVTKSGAVLTWSTPADTGGLAVSDYVVETSVDNGVTWLAVAHTASNSTQMTLSKLAGDTAYLVRVSAKNSTGVSEATYESFVTPAGSPTSARDLRATPSGSTATLSWLAPASDNGASITDYMIEVSNDGGVKWVEIAHTAFIGTSFTVTGLKAGSAYRFRVSAINAYGKGDLSNVVSMLTAGNAPSAPTNLSVTTKTTTSITLSWAPAKVASGSAVREYIVEYSKNKGLTWTRVSSVTFKSLSLTVKGFKSKTTYVFRVSARNDVGVSTFSNRVTVATR